MSEQRNKGQNLPTAKESIDPALTRRVIRSPIRDFTDFMTSRDVVMMTMFSSAASLAVFPQGWLGILPVSLGYYAWVSSKKYRLPFKVPQNWGGVDYGAPKPGGSGYSKAAGILYFGQDQASLEELWIENGDARRHGFFLGTTGSGKALPLDTPVLTPRGWVENGGLRPGDEICHPFGGTSTVLSVHPQGKIAAARIWFADGRHADCSLDHLWHVRVRARAKVDGAPSGATGHETGAEGKNMTAADIGILHGLQGDRLHIEIPLSIAHQGITIPEGSDLLGESHARRAAREGLHNLAYMPSLYGTPEQRTSFLRNYLRAADIGVNIEKHGVRLSRLPVADAKILKQLVWSLGGIATIYTKSSFKQARAGVDLTVMFEGICGIWPQAGVCEYPGQGGLEIIEVERLAEDLEMSCIKTSRDDGLYVMENHIVTHNTELLLGVVSQTLMWSSGFMFIDGKGTTEFYARAWTLAKRFGREDDVRVLNFTDAGGDPDAPAGGPDVQSNTLNPFAKGGADQLMNLIVGLMGDAGQGNDMWKNRAMSLVTAAMKALVQMRESGDILLDVQAIRDFLPLGVGVKKELLKGRPVKSIEEIPEEAWHEMRTRAGMIELYLRALKGDFSKSAALALKAFFDTLPGFSLEKAMRGDPPDSKASEQYGFLSMQLTKPLGSLADDYGHIFRTPLGEVDIDDVVLNRRILIVLLPALQKAPEEMQMCGKIVVNLVKIMMGNASGSMLQGSRQEIVESKQTRAPSPFIVVLDEAGYYMVKGIDVMMAQGRSLGFMIIIAGQDMAAMQSINAQIAETAAANASIFAAGKTVDGDKTLTFITKLFGRAQVAVSSGYSTEAGFIGPKFRDRMDVSFQEVDKVKVDEMQNMMEGEFYFLFNGTLVRAATFYIGGDFAAGFSVNKFLKVRGPTDRVPGLDQTVEIHHIQSTVDTTESLFRLAHDPNALPAVAPLDDVLSVATKVSGGMLWNAGKAASLPENIHYAWIGGLICAQGTGMDQDDGVSGENWEDELDTDGLIGSLDDITLGDEFEEFGRLPSRSDSASRHRSSQHLPRRLLDEEADDFDDTESSVVSGLARAARGQSPRERHGGMIDLLIAQERACEAARRNAETAPEMKEEEASAAVEDIQSRKSMGEFFNFVAENSSRFAKIFAEEHVDGETGLEILRRSGAVRPLPLDSVSDPGFMLSAVEQLERAISTDEDR